MKRQPKTLTVLTALAAAIMVLVPFHGFLTVWGAILVGHYTGLRLWKEYLLIVLMVGTVALLVRRGKHQGSVLQALRRQPLVALCLAYLVVLLLAGMIALAAGGVTPKALVFGLLLDTRFIIFFLIVWFLSARCNWVAAHWRQLLLIPAAATILFGLAQFSLLPPDFLSHFGYGPATIDAVQTVDEKAGYQRIQSTLRGANPFGAYLVIVLSALGVLLLTRGVAARRRWLYAALFMLGCTALALTFSRSAWIGAFAAFVWLLWQAVRSIRARRWLLVAGATSALVFGAVGYSLRNNDVFQNTFFHTDEHSKSAASSNEGHLSATRSGIIDIAYSPAGSGTGTAGPASVYNDKPARIAENYFVQIGQEAGLVGMGLFIAINLLLGRQLLRRRGQLLPQLLLASLIGISLVNLLSHAWTDDTLAYIWWGLAGAAMALSPMNVTERPVATGPTVAAADTDVAREAQLNG